LNTLAWQDPIVELGPNAQATDIGTGKSNTEFIANWLRTNGQATDRAVIFCDELDEGGKTDWFLPSRYELQEMYNKRYFIGNMGTNNYWSSSEATYDTSKAIGFMFNLGIFGAGNKDVNYVKYVRCARAFSDQITYNANGADSGTVPAVQTKLYNVDLTLQTNSGSLVRTGFTFSGWNTRADGSGTDYAAGGTYTNNDAVTLYAKWLNCSEGYYIGCTGPGGGVVFYDKANYDDGWRYLESAPSDAPTELAWSNQYIYIEGTTETDIGKGSSNTDLIMSWVNEDSGHEAPASEYCNTLTSGSKSDWFLPSRDELVEIYLKKEFISNIVLGDSYWSSSNPSHETYKTNYAHMFTFSGWNPDVVTHKINLRLVRCIRSFSDQITYNANGADSGTVPSSQTKLYNVNLTLQTNTGSLVRSGYTFAGWNTAADGSGTDYAAGGTYTSNEGLTLYALWKQIYSVGDSGPGGGIVFYDKGTYSDGWRYLESSLANAPTTLVWQDPYVSISGIGTAIGTGMANTQAIVTWLRANSQSTDRAALYCDDLVEGGKSDWFLPSKDELNQMYINRDTIGGFGGSSFWYSSQLDASRSGGQVFGSGFQYNDYKSNLWNVRCARAF
jgi:uncharacterized repeat protein (TIGR02543 family)